MTSEDIKKDFLGAEGIGKTIVKEFVKARLIKKDVKFHDSLKQQKFPLWGSQGAACAS